MGLVVCFNIFLEEAEKENVPIIIPQKNDKILNRTIDQSLHETLVDTLKTEIDHERSIRLQEQLPLRIILCISLYYYYIMYIIV